MNQTALALDAADGPDRPQPATSTQTPDCEVIGFALGWDHARHGLVPPAGLLLDGTPVSQGWRAGRAVFGRRIRATTRHTRQWLALRTDAWRAGVPFEADGVTPHYLAQIDTAVCPVLRRPLGGVPGSELSAVVDRIHPDVGYVPGNLLVLSRAAARARRGVDVMQAVRRARAAEAAGEELEGLSDAAWWRLAALRAFADPALPFATAASLPLAVLPPNRVRVLGAAQALQVLVTWQFVEPAWSERTRVIAQMLPEHTLRIDFNLFVGALAPRVLEAVARLAGGDDMRRALEDAWLGERVQRRWRHFVLACGDAGVEYLVQAIAKAKLPGRTAIVQAFEQATEGWGLPVAAAVVGKPKGPPADAATRTIRRIGSRRARPAGPPTSPAGRTAALSGP